MAYVGMCSPFTCFGHNRISALVIFWGVISYGRRGGLMVSVLLSGWSSPGLSPANRFSKDLVTKWVQNHILKSKSWEKEEVF